MAFYSTPKRFKSGGNTLQDAECRLRVGQAYLAEFPWKSCVSEVVQEWLELVAGARKCRPEYVLLSMLPTIAAICGPSTKLEISEGYHEEKLNLFLCILGESGANKSGSYALANGILKSCEETSNIILDSNWSRSGLLSHLSANKGHCLLAYEEMDPFFANVMKMEKQGVSERTFFCELYDGRPQSVIRSTNDGKVSKLAIGDTAMNIVGYHQPEPFLMDYYDLSLRKDGFMERFLICCPPSMRLSQTEVEKCRDTLNKEYTPKMRDLKALYNTICEMKAGGLTLRLSYPAKADYEELAAEENDDYNKNIEEKMAMAKADIQFSQITNNAYEIPMETKYVRSILKLSAALHILEEGFSGLLTASTNVNDEISLATFRRGKALAQYFSGQRNALFKLNSTVLVTLGVISGLHIMLPTYNVAYRPDAETIMEMFDSLEKEGYGKLGNERLLEGFLKCPKMSIEQAERYGFSVEEYEMQLKAANPKLSGTAAAVFERLYINAYPITAPNTSHVKLEPKK